MGVGEVDAASSSTASASVHQQSLTYDPEQRVSAHDILLKHAPQGADIPDQGNGADGSGGTPPNGKRNAEDAPAQDGKKRKVDVGLQRNIVCVARRRYW